MMRWILFVLSLFWLVSCATIPSPQERQSLADELAAIKGWQSSRLPAGRFDLVAYIPSRFTPADTLTVYIEGDGFAWVTDTLPSTDPTPRMPLALRLALSQPAGNAAYLARPCQYVDAERTGCPQRYWTEQRFAPEVVTAANQAIDVLKVRFGARRLTLVGYSGGGAVAALVAARRNDVVQLVTVAGNLDHRAWTAYQRIRPLAGSLNAADVASQLDTLPQIHFVGAKDRIIPPDLARRWPREFIGENAANLRIMPGYDHSGGWAEHWPELLN